MSAKLDPQELLDNLIKSYLDLFEKKPKNKTEEKRITEKKHLALSGIYGLMVSGVKPSSRYAVFSVTEEMMGRFFKNHLGI